MYYYYTLTCEKIATDFSGNAEIGGIAAFAKNKLGIESDALLRFRLKCGIMGEAKFRGEARASFANRKETGP